MGGNRERTPIVALTAHVIAQPRMPGARAGMDGVLHKPFTLARLAEVISTHASGTHAVPVEVQSRQRQPKVSLILPC